ncbi:ATP-binding protein, partial [bacterium]|nr:ATP-binding protein [bacterium]
MQKLNNSWKMVSHYKTSTEDTVILSYDITDLKSLEKDLRQSKVTADSANKHKSEFLANMSHEIRTPMNGIIGFCELALKTRLNEAQRDYLEKIDLSARSLLYIINEILDFSKIEAGELQIERLSFDLQELLDGIETLFAYQIVSKGIRFHVNRNENVPRFLIGDPTRIHQILVNLMSNAIKFTNAGEIKVTVESMGQIDNNHVLQFCVTDTGIGIESEKINTLFSAFTQADGSTSRQYGGTGLGLSIIKQLVHLMDGSVGIVSKIDQGSQFWFDLEMEESSSEDVEFHIVETKTKHSGIKFKSGCRVLLVEDNEINQALIDSILQDVNIYVDIVANGQEAIDIIEKNELKGLVYEVILMDIQMPIMDGYQAIELIREMLKYKDVPIIALTASALSKHKYKCIESGATDYISKPIDLNLLLNLLKNYLPDHKVLDSSPKGKKYETVALPGIDQEMALKRIGYNEQLLDLLIRQYASSQENKFIEIHKSLDNQDFDLMKFLVHGLKVLAGSIGAIKLYKLC